MSWDYAELSKAAKAAGGPDKFLNDMVEASKTEGRIEMLPAVIAAAAGAAIAVKVIEYFRNKRHDAQNTIDEAKEELKKGIEKYDREHADENMVLQTEGSA